MEEQTNPTVRQFNGGSRMIFGLFDPAVLQSLDWRPLREGIEFFPVYGEPGVGPSAAILKYAAGAKLPLHMHQGFEHVLVLSRYQQDENGRAPAGTLVINPPGSQHQVLCPEGGIALVIWERPVKFL